jgi:DNA-binding IclR family transcriptional regulator
MQILLSFSTERPRWRVSELSETLELHPSTVSRLLTTLRKTGVVRKDPLTGEYELSLRVLDLAQVVISQLDLVKVAHPFMIDLVTEYKESAFIVVLDGTNTVTVAQVTAPRVMTSARYTVGRRSLAHAVSGGKVLLAHSPKSVVDGLIKKGLYAYTPHTITSPRKLLSMLEQVRQQGYAIADQELEIGLFAVAAPIWGREDKVIAAVSISGPRERLSNENLPEFIVGIREAAQQISTALGWSRPTSS